jgi:type VI secretion system secreted protein Hcp
MKRSLFVFLLLACSTFQLSAAIYMKFPGIDGEATASGHEKEIEIGSINLGIARAVTAPTGGSSTREASAPTISEISITKMMDISSTLFMMSATAGKGQDNVVISLTATDKGELFTYCKITLSNVLVSSYSVSSGGDRPSESLSLNFTKIQVDYYPSVPTGTPPPKVSPFTWDLAAQKSF